MFKKTVEYDDYDGNRRKEDFYFHLSGAELIEMEAATPGGMEARLMQVVKDNDGGEIVKVFTELVRKTYGKKSEDGRRFQKSDEIWNEFYESSAYDIFFMGLVTDANACAEFANAILPQKMLDELREKQTKLAASPELQQRAAEAVKSIESVPLPKFNPELVREIPPPPKEPNVLEEMNVDISRLGPERPKRRFEDYSREELVAMPFEEFERLSRGRGIPME